MDKRQKAIEQGLLYLEIQLDTQQFPFSSDCFGKARHDLKSQSDLPEFPYGDLHETFNLYLLLLHLEPHLPSRFRNKLIRAIRPKEVAPLNFFGNIDGDNEKFPNDLETTSVCYYALLATNTVTKLDLVTLSKSVFQNVNDDGLLHLYYVPRGDPRYNRLDAVCMTNVIRFAYAQRYEHLVQRSEDYVFDWLNSGKYKSGTLYYPSGYTFLYFCSLLASANYRTRITFMDTLRHEYNQIKQEDLKYPLDYAQTILTGAKIGLYDQNAIQKLLDMQNEDGSWPADATYATNKTKIYFGSRSISTMLSVLALMETIQMH